MMMTFGHELGLAEETGLTEDPARADRATEIRDGVVDEIGEATLVQAFIDSDYEMHTSDKEAVIERALDVSGYNRARAQLFREEN